METQNLLIRISNLDRYATDKMYVEAQIVENDRSIKLFIQMNCSIELIHKWECRNELLKHRIENLNMKISRELKFLNEKCVTI